MVLDSYANGTESGFVKLFVGSRLAHKIKPTNTHTHTHIFRYCYTISTIQIWIDPKIGKMGDFMKLEHLTQGTVSEQM